MAKHYKLSDTPKIGCPKKCVLWLEIMFQSDNSNIIKWAELQNRSQPFFLEFRYEDGKFADGIDVEEIYAKSNAILERLRQKRGWCSRTVKVLSIPCSLAVRYIVCD